MNVVEASSPPTDLRSEDRRSSTIWSVKVAPFGRVPNATVLRSASTPPKVATGNSHCELLGEACNNGVLASSACRGLMTSTLGSSDEANLNDLNNYNTVQSLQLEKIPTYNTKYSGKIYVYMNPQNGSAAWFFITYLIYAFAKKQDIIRHQSSCFENTYKYGIVLPYHQLILRGKSGTTSGDGNPEPIVVRKNDTNILVHCPTEQFISSSILPKDWNRFWSEG